MGTKVRTECVCSTEPGGVILIWFSIVMAGTQTHHTVGDRVWNSQAGWSECNRTHEGFMSFSRIPFYAIML